jgi:tetratricopeptide (TPR) repeat protein
VSKVKADRNTVFAKAALKNGLVTRQQAQECLSIARKLLQRGKALPIETVFVRKGYLRKAEAAALVKRIRPKKKKKAAAAPSLDLLPDEPVQERCGSCKKDPGDGDDCYHCGADLETGGPGPRATVCESCQGVVLRGSAICFHCGSTIRRRRARREGRTSGGKALERLILLATVAGMGYFLVYRNLNTGPSTPEAAPVEAAAGTDAAMDKAVELAREGKVKEAIALLEARLEKIGDASEGRDERLRVHRAIAMLAKGEPARRAAGKVLKLEEDPRLRRRLAVLAMEENKPKVAERELRGIPKDLRHDREWRMLARAERAQSGGDWVTPLLEVKQLQPGERTQLGLGLWKRAQSLLAKGKLEPAVKDLLRAVKLAPRHAGVWRSLGAAQLSAKRPADAKVAYRQAIRLDARPAAPYLGLGLALEALNERRQAKVSFEHYLRLAREEGGQDARINQVELRLTKY